MATKKFNPMGPAVDLLAQLNDPGNAAALLVPDSNRRYPHWTVLHNYFFFQNIYEREKWASCLRVLIELKAPISHNRQAAAALFFLSNWQPARQLTSELAKEYLTAGLIDTEKPLVVPFAGPFGKWSNDTGRLPMAVCIWNGNSDALRVLCEAGASWNIGPVDANGPDREAFEYATEIGSEDALCVLAEYVMRHRLEKSDSGQMEDPETGTSRRRMRL